MVHQFIGGWFVSLIADRHFDKKAGTEHNLAS
jgi:hypothetical protein